MELLSLESWDHVAFLAENAVHKTNVWGKLNFQPSPTIWQSGPQNAALSGRLKVMCSLHPGAKGQPSSARLGGHSGPYAGPGPTGHREQTPVTCPSPKSSGYRLCPNDYLLKENFRTQPTSLFRKRMIKPFTTKSNIFKQHNSSFLSLNGFVPGTFTRILLTK